jgi:hypothetical protein
MPPAARKPPQSDSIDRIMNDPALPPPDEDDFRKRDLSRRSRGPALAPWLIVVLILMLAAFVYSVSAVLT